MSQQNMQAYARKMYFEDDFFLLTCRNPAKAIASFGQDAFEANEKQAIKDFAAERANQTGSAIDQLGGGGIIDLGHGGCGVWC